MYLKMLAAPQNDEVNLMVRTLSSYWREKTKKQNWIRDVKSYHDIQSEKVKSWETEWAFKK